MRIFIILLLLAVASCETTPQLMIDKYDICPVVNETAKSYFVEEENVNVYIPIGGKLKIVTTWTSDYDYIWREKVEVFGTSGQKKYKKLFNKLGNVIHETGYYNYMPIFLREWYDDGTLRAEIKWYSGRVSISRNMHYSYSYNQDGTLIEKLDYNSDGSVYSTCRYDKTGSELNNENCKRIPFIKSMLFAALITTLGLLFFNKFETNQIKKHTKNHTKQIKKQQ